VSPVRVDVPRMLLGIGGFPDLFRWRPEHGTEVIVVPIDRPREVVRFTTDAFFQWHFVNAWDDEGGGVVVDYVRYPTFASFGRIGDLGAGAAPSRSEPALDGRYHRATIDPRARTLRSEPRFVDRACEFATVAPGAEGRAHGATYLVLGDLAAVGRLDARTGELVTHELPATQRTTEPIFVPRPGATRDDDGHVVALQHDGPSDRAFLAVYDAARLPDGPIARAWFDHHVPITFHGTFQRDARA
jgi:all-trans-8'-apo-beta-carotenal 15,15'-oxygenase